MDRNFLVNPVEEDDCLEVSDLQLPADNAAVQIEGSESNTDYV